LDIPLGDRITEETIKCPNEPDLGIQHNIIPVKLTTDRYSKIDTAAETEKGKKGLH
jgi:hypothetical protein